MKKIGVLLIGLLFIISVNAETSTQQVEFVRCVDGDTAVFNVDGVETKFRFLAIDTPETVNPTKAVEEYGKDASEYTCNKLTNANQIIVEYENSNKTDKYGRSLGWIWVDGSLLQKELINVGYAKVSYIYGKYRYTESLCLIQSYAKQEKYGLWGNETEDGYCSTVDLTNVKDIIDYENISVAEKQVSKKEKEIYDALEKIDKIENKISKFISKNESKLQKGGYFLFVVIGIIVLIIKELK